MNNATTNITATPITSAPIFTHLKLKKKNTSMMSKAEFSAFVKEDFRIHIELKLSTLERGVIYTLKKMCDPSFWNSHHPAARRGPGRYISQLVKEGRLLLVALEKNSSKSKQYMLK